MLRKTAATAAPLTKHPLIGSRAVGPSHQFGSGVRQQRGAETRASILQAAERIFAEVGPEGARTEAIAEAAGVNKALIYYYFKGKDDLYLAVLESHLTEFRRRALGVLGSKGSARVRLLRYVSLHFDFISARPYYPRLMHRLMSTDNRLVQRVVQEYSAPIYRKLAELIEEGVRSREFRQVNSHHTIYSLVGLSVFYFAAAPIVKELTQIDAFDRANVACRRDEVLKFIRYGLFREPATPVH
jgi:TetR/AcrR family transcriptional regulator